MIRVIAITFVALAFLVLPLCGCGPQTSQTEKTYQVKIPQGIEKAKQLLQAYAKGQPVGSEAESFPTIVEEVRQSDPAKADVLAKGFEDLKSSPSPKKKAEELLKEL